MTILPAAIEVNSTAADCGEGEFEESNLGRGLSAHGIRPGVQSGRVIRGLIPNPVRVHFQRRFLRVSSWAYPTTEKIDMNSW